MSGEDLYVLALQLGLQYLIPAAVLLRALYAGMRGRMPDGWRDIGAGALLAGLGALADGDAADVGEAVIQVFSNALFIASLLIFTVIYLLRVPNYGRWADGILGGFIGLLSWLVWVPLLGNDWPVWTIPLVVIAGTAAYIALRGLLRQVAKLALLALRLIQVGVAVAVIGGVIWLITQFV